MAFPTSPSNNQTAIVNGITYAYDSSKNAWVRQTISAGSIDQTARNIANTANAVSQSAYTFANTVNSYSYSTNAFVISSNTAMKAYVDQANTGMASYVVSSNTAMKSYVDQANTGLKSYVDQANTGMASYVVASNTAMKAYVDQANTGLKSYGDATYATKTGGTITGSLSITNDLTVSGNLNIVGNTTTINVSSFVVNDPLVFFAGNNFTSDVVDIGFVAHYNDGANAHTGLFRDPNLKEYLLFKNYTPEVSGNNLINIANPTFAYSNLYVGTLKGNVSANTVNTSSIGVTNLYANNYYFANGVALTTGGGGGGGTATLNGFNNNSVITANSLGYLSNTTNLQFFSSNNNLVITGNVIGGGVRSTSAATPPTNPTVGDIWYYTNTDTIYRYTSDGTTSVWLDITGTNISGNNVNYGISIGKAVAMAMIFGG